MGAVLEGWILATVDVQFSGNGENVTMWHDRAWYFRQTMFLLLPVCLHLLPPENNALSPTVTLPTALQSVERLVGSLQVLDNVRATSMREGYHRARAAEFWEEEARLADSATQDGDVQEEAGRAGLGYVEAGAPLAVAAKEIATQWKALMLQVLGAGL